MTRAHKAILTGMMLTAALSVAAVSQVLPTPVLERAQSHAIRGDYRRAVAVYDTLLSLPGLRNSMKFQGYDGRARCRRILGDYGGAIADYDSALALPASARNHAIITLNRANVLLSTGQYAETMASIDALDTAGMAPDIKYRAIGDKAGALTRSGRYDEAEVLYRRLLDTDHPAIEKELTGQNLGFTLMLAGKPAEGRRYLSYALDMSGHRKNPSVRGAIILSNLALAEAMTGDVPQALRDIDEAIAFLGDKLGKQHADYITALRKKAEIHLMSGDNAAALGVFKPYYSLLRDNVLATFPALTEQGRLDYWKKEKPLMSELFATGNEDALFLLDVSLLRRGVALTGADKAFGPKASARLAVNGNDLRKKLRAGETAVDFIVYPRIDSTGNITDRMGALVATRTDTRFTDLGSTSDIENWRVAGRGFGPASRSNVDRDKDAIYRDTTLFAKVWGDILSIAPESRVVYFAPDGLFNLAAIEMLRIPASLADKENIRFHRLTTLANIIDRDRKRADNGTTLVAGGISYDEMPAVDAANPNHDALRYMVRINNGKQIFFAALDGMRRESIAIDSILDHSRLFTHLTEEEFKKVAGGYHRMHLSTHGYTLALDQPRDNLWTRDTLSADNSLLASGLVLSGANISQQYPERDDGLLSARELCDLDLSNIDFAVLAACQTAIGHVDDEGPAGILRGLKKAGVHTVVATLWEVNDNATLLFMTTFYDALNKGMSKYDAFHLARNTVRDFKREVPVTTSRFDPATMTSVRIDTGKTRTTTPFAKPSMWAPFILIDDI